MEGMSEITLKIKGYADHKGLKVSHYRIDNEHSNAYMEWIRQGKPLFPQGEQYKAIKAKDELEQYCPEFTVDSTKDTIELTFTMPIHGVSFLQIEKDSTYGK
jgi:xylan 1,4-beta-xylosidase